MSNRRALLVGVNQFQFLPGATLRGCVNDTLDMAALLKDLLGFKDEDITLLHDAAATKATIMARLTEQVEAAKRGDVKYLVFHFSSHGTQVPDVSGDETDHADEAFCPHDLQQKGDQWDPEHVIIDDELHDLFSQLPRNVLLEAYFDTCHSGTGLKVIDLLGFPDRPKPRYLPPPTFSAFERVAAMRAKGLPDLRAGKPATKKAADKQDREAVAAFHNHILWAGCRADQTSADATFAGRPNGAFTYFYVQTLRETNNQVSRRKALIGLRAKMKKAGFDQLVQLESDATNRDGRLPEP